ncbi:hypothetical protein J32TS2_32230 [Shouchella clausii]|jgi:hypothetical protein|uniref:Uncharacterized protein n=2 Tax=Shouchella TaxID=2893057 RepID=A0A268P1G0_SHOCL|nr:hypothetical protein [Shouchella clausii]MDO7267503.1 hypothetical protein [Shouchella clausii]MDO7287543.1 hypothetical protein [Shouchella clausii]PAE89567.1 hypothetical protein CHH72_07975 [Shouchella clausii]GIN17867.1 hypothetical protein J32TS2_32230 [Shouchella clausii]
MSFNQKTNVHKEHIQLKQRLLHYRSETVKNERLLRQQEKKLLEQKRIIDGLTDRLEELAQQAEKNSGAGANDYEQNSTRQAIIVPYFSYSILAPSTFEEDETVLVKGHFVIENKGTAPLSTPIICLAFNKPELANLTGKINRPRAPKDHVAQMNESDGWSFLEESGDAQAKETGQYWLKPKTAEIPALSTVMFSNFEIQLPMAATSSVAMQVNGFVYGDEHPEGIPALNAIAFTLV